MVLRVSVCSELFFLIEGLDFYQTVDVIAELGEESRLEQKTGIRLGVELAPFTEGKPVTEISPEERAKRRDNLKKNQVPLTGLHWILAGGDPIFGAGKYFIPKGPHITTPHGTRRCRSADYAAEVFRYGTELNDGNPLVAVWGSPAQRNLIPGTEYQAAENNAANAFARILRRDDHNVTIALERLVRLGTRLGEDKIGETDFCYTMTQVDTVVSLTRNKLRLDRRERVGSMLDVKAAKNMGDNPLEVLRNPFLVPHIHVQDPYSFGPPGWNSNGEFLGDGHYDFRPLVAAAVELSKTRDVDLSAEPFDLPPKKFFTTHGLRPYNVFRKSVEYLGDLIQEAMTG
ncbi:hypothetical protein GF386_02445 [Candidatus Pacearchaeota archaeon]|nr:hypothetical protein [Candidatus Pacearchaeota archaeon]MBD3283004.1 hypothetical protein [Candidatus Pacearchaeota archaeon]